MDLKNTKATGHFFTGSKFSNMALQNGIVKPSAGLKNSFTSINQFKGVACERAVTYLLLRREWHLEFQRARTEISEIDLIFSKEKKIILVEVKKLDEGWQAFERIGKKQFQGLQGNLNLFTYRFSEWHVRAYIAWVNRKNEVTFLSVE